MPGRRGTPERFLTTVLMTDIVGSTEHATELGDNAWRDLLAQHHSLVRAALRRHGGRELDTAGDGFFAVFDAPAGAISCALEIVDNVTQLGIEVRAGVHVGEVEQAGRKVGGISVPIASRIMSAAEPSEVLVSSTVRDLVTGSGLAFEGRGVRELKGVPGEWHLYAVRRVTVEVDGSTGGTAARELRAASVRRAAARPIWQRRPRLVTAAVLGLAVILATSGLLIWKPWALRSVSENSVGIIDSGSSELVGQIPVGARPGGIAVGEGYAWVTNTGANSVSQVNVETREVIQRIDVGQAPKGIAVSEGSVWVANSGARTVSRINVATGRVVQTIVVGNGPTAIVAASSLLWVANATDSTVVSIDARTGTTGQPIGVGAGPIALAADEGGLWVASEDGASVSHLDPGTGVTQAAPIQLAARPSALALDPESVWVASADGTVTRIERATSRVTATIPVGGRLAAIVIGNSAVWVGDSDGNVYRLDAANPSSRQTRISTTSAVASLAVVEGGVWLAAQPSAASHRGGTLRIVQILDFGRFATDPLGDPVHTTAPLVADGLVGYRRVGGSAGATLLADLATSVPQPTNAGLTYTFQLRPNLEYSTGEPVRASDFRRGIERSFQIEGGLGLTGYLFFRSISGADACWTDTGTPLEPKRNPVERCNLAAGILTDERTNTVTIELSQPDPDFLFKLAHPAAYPVPEGVPMNRLLDGEAFPGTGPYVVSAVTDNEVRLARNPRFHLQDAAVRPDGFPDEIVFTSVAEEAQPFSMVERGEADLVFLIGGGSRSSELVRLKAQYAGQWHVGMNNTQFVAFNTKIPPFDNLEARRAVNFAMDRGQMAEFLGGPPDAVVTCQFLPPGFPGYRPYCPYTMGRDEGGQWKGPDLQKAQQLVDESGTGGTRVTVGATGWKKQQESLRAVLEDLGYEASIDSQDIFRPDWPGWDPAVDQIIINGWAPDYVAPSNFLGLFTCGDDQSPVTRYCDTAFDAAFDHALELQSIDPAAALSEWADVDHRAVDLALLAPMYNLGSHFVSARVGNFQFSPAYQVLYDQMWVQ